MSRELRSSLRRGFRPLSAEKIDALFRKWLRRLPHPFTVEDQAAGIRYELSILQAEFSLTQVLDRPVTGRLFFEEVIRENLDIGRPDQVQLVFERRLVRKGRRATPGRFRTRVITEGVYPSLHVDHKATRIKQYHKEGRAQGLRYALFLTRSYDRIFRPGLAAVLPHETTVDSTLRASFRQLETAMTSWAENAELASRNLTRSATSAGVKTSSPRRLRTTSAAPLRP